MKYTKFLLTFYKSYIELQAPIHYTDMTLLDISYLNKKRYMYDSNLISVNRVEEQDSKSKRTEIQVNDKTLRNNINLSHYIVILCWSKDARRIQLNKKMGFVFKLLNRYIQ